MRIIYSYLVTSINNRGNKIRINKAKKDKVLVNRRVDIRLKEINSKISSMIIKLLVLNSVTMLFNVLFIVLLITMIIVPIIIVIYNKLKFEKNDSVYIKRVYVCLSKGIIFIVNNNFIRSLELISNIFSKDKLKDKHVIPEEDK